MKKLLLIAMLALGVTSCEKEEVYVEQCYCEVTRSSIVEGQGGSVGIVAVTTYETPCDQVRAEVFALEDFKSAQEYCE